MSSTLTESAGRSVHGPVEAGDEPRIPKALNGVGNRLPVSLMAVTLVAGLVQPELLVRAGPVVAAVGLLLGLPHGAVDHLVPRWVTRRPLSLAVTGLMLTGYVAAAAAMWLLLRGFPRPALALFFALSLLHFGAGEVAYDRLRRGWRYRPGPVAWALEAFAWGSVVVLLPVCRWQDEVGPILDRLAPGSSSLLTPGVRVVVLVTVGTAVLVSAASAVARRRHRAAAELLLVALTMVSVPPLIAFAVYFGTWHSFRHVVRLLAEDPTNEADLRAGRRAGPALRFVRLAAVPTVISVIAVLALWATAGSDALLTSDLQLLAALTVPHMAVVGWMDRQGRSAADGSTPGREDADGDALLPGRLRPTVP